MSFTVSVDPLYVAARKVLLDALEALADHSAAIVVVGAQAVYLRTGDTDLDSTVAPYTADADLALDPGQLADEPDLASAMQAAGFRLKVKRGGGVEPGSWIADIKVDGIDRQVPVDLIVPAARAVGHGRRDARLSNQGPQAARWAAGLEAALVDYSPMTVSSLEPESDHRVATVHVAGTAALIIAKCHKLNDRLDDERDRPHRIRSKDAADVIRLMRGPESAAQIGTRLAELANHADAGPTVHLGVILLRELFAAPRSPGWRWRRAHSLARWTKLRFVRCRRALLVLCSGPGAARAIAVW